LERTIQERRQNPSPDSYCSDLFSRGIGRIAQKLGEESAEVIIAALGKGNDREFLEESADLLFHLLVLLAERGKKYDELIRVLRSRHRSAY
jgi:phosphoribosyl-ATP pyrophosphohydrolase/phosphoribosyl-AMP cyclohydrolase